MRFGLGDERRAAPVITLVLRQWRAGGTLEPGAFRYQTIHVQTGDVAYFRTIDSVMRYVQRLTERPATESASHAPIPLFPHSHEGA